MLQVHKLSWLAVDMPVHVYYCQPEAASAQRAKSNMKERGNKKRELTIAHNAKTKGK